MHWASLCTEVEKDVGREKQHKLPFYFACPGMSRTRKEKSVPPSPHSLPLPLSVSKDLPGSLSRVHVLRHYVSVISSANMIISPVGDFFSDTIESMWTWSIPAKSSGCRQVCVVRPSPRRLYILTLSTLSPHSLNSFPSHQVSLRVASYLFLDMKETQLEPLTNCFLSSLRACPRQ